MKYSYKAGISFVESLNLTKMFFNINAVSGENLAEIDVIKANRQLIHLLNGRPNNITETKAANLLVDVKDKKQSIDIMKLKTLNNCPVSMSSHGTLNQTKGTIYYLNRPKFPKEQLLYELFYESC